MAAGLAAPSLAQQAQEQRISKDALDCAEKITGIDFSDADQQQALGGVNNNLASFERLREHQHSARHRASHHVPTLPARQEAEARRHSQREGEGHDGCSGGETVVDR